MLTVCGEESEAKPSELQVEKASWVPGLGPFGGETSLVASSYPAVAANPASWNLPRSQAVSIWEARQLSALVSFVKSCLAFHTALRANTDALQQFTLQLADGQSPFFCLVHLVPKSQ